MKKLLILLLLVPSLSWGFFSTPLEECMDKVIDGTFNGDESRSFSAAKVCKGANKSVLKCMDKVIDGTFNGDESRSFYAAKVCNGS